MFRINSFRRVIAAPMCRQSVNQITALTSSRAPRFLRLGACVIVGAVAKIHLTKSVLSCSAVMQDAQLLHPPKHEAAKVSEVVLAIEETPHSWWETLEGWAANTVTFLRAWYRMAYCTTVVSSVAWLAPVILTFQDKEALYAYIIRCIQHLGPTFIKLAQWASSRPDLFDEELIVHLVRLQDSTNTYPLSVTHATFRSEFGDNWADRLTIDPVPIGSGCIAQVYKGKLKAHKDAPDSEAQAVAVKVIHPHVDAMVTQDMGILRALADMLSKWPQMQYLALAETVEIFASNMIDQLDLRAEAAHIDKFRENFKDDKFVSFPKPFHSHVTKHVLVEELVEGKSITTYATPEYDEKFKIKLCGLAVHGMLKMVFNDNFTHGDLHPGNILVQMTDQGPKIVFLDCGIVTDAKDKHETLLDIVLAFMKFDGYRAGELMLEHRANDPGIEGFCEGVRDIVNKSINERSLEHMGEYVNMLCALSYKYKVKMVPEFLMVAMAIKIAEGVGTQLNPEFRFSDVAIPYIMKAQSKYMLSKLSHRLHID